MDYSVKPETAKPDDDDDLFVKLKAWFTVDREHRDDWETDAREDYEFVAGRQYTAEEEQILRDANRPDVKFNRIGPVVDVVCGQEVANRQEVRFIPRTLDDSVLTERMTEAARWFRDQTDAEDEDSDAFRDAVICGMGWSEYRYDADDGEGKPVVERIDPFEMFWDCHARRSNIVDARRVFRVRQISRADAKAMFPDADEACLDAAWATLDEDDEDPNRSDRKFYDRDGESADYDGEDDAMVTIVQCQWKEDGEFFRVSTADGSKLDIPGDEWPELEARLKEQAIEYSASPFFKKIVKQAFLGSKVLETGAAPNGTQFSFTCITGKRDRNKGYWYGVVRPMKDPQRWANKWMSQALHILNTNAKGGILAEEGAFSDIKEAERTWARSDAITWAKNGALAAGKVQPKPVPPMPQGFMQLMEFAVSSVRDTVGVSVEMIGAQEAGQAASLEYQRRQTTMTILAGLFDSLRRYRKLSGRLLLEIIKKDIPPDTLVRITDDGTPSYQPLTLEAQQISYDIVVDDAPTAPNQKEAAWATIQQMLPVIGQQLTPELWLSILKYSPLPSSVISEVQQKIEKQSATPPQDPRIAMEQAKFQGQMQLEQAKMAAQRDKEASQMQADIEVEKARMEREAIATRVNAELQISLKEMDQALEREKMMVQLQLEATKLGIETRKTEMEMQRDAVTAQAQPANEAETADTSKPDRIAEIMAAFAEASQRIADTQAQLALPRRIVRDPATNRVMGVEIVQPEMQGAMQ